MTVLLSANGRRSNAMNLIAVKTMEMPLLGGCQIDGPESPEPIFRLVPRQNDEIDALTTRLCRHLSTVSEQLVLPTVFDDRRQ